MLIIHGWRIDVILEILKRLANPYLFILWARLGTVLCIVREAGIVCLFEVSYWWNIQHFAGIGTCRVLLTADRADVALEYVVELGHDGILSCRLLLMLCLLKLVPLLLRRCVENIAVDNTLEREIIIWGVTVALASGTNFYRSIIWGSDPGRVFFEVVCGLDLTLSG